MSIRGWWNEPTDANWHRLLACFEDWIDQTAAGLTCVDAQASGNAKAMTLERLQRDLPALRDSGAERVTQGFLDGDLTAPSLEGMALEGREEEPPTVADRLDRLLPEYGLALFHFHLLQVVRSDIERREAAESLARSMAAVPIHRAVRRENRRLIDAVLQLWEEATRSDQPHRLVSGWIRKTPKEFGHAVAVAKTSARQDADRLNPKWRIESERGKKEDEDSSFLTNATLDSSQGVRDRQREEVHPAGREGGGHPKLYEALFDLCCRVVRRYEFNDGRRLFLWLLLGGVRPTKNLRADWHAWPLMKVPLLIDAMIFAFGKNFQRDFYEKQIRGLMKSEGLRTVVWDAFVEEIMAAGGLRSELPTVLPDTLSERLDDGWEVFLQVSAQTAMLRRFGELQVVPPGAFASSATGVAEGTTPDKFWKWVMLGTDTNPPRGTLVWVAETLCEQLTTEAEWLSLLKQNF